MYTKITSYNHEEFMGKGDASVHVNIRYWVDDNNEYWYAYQDICDLVNLNENIAKTWYKRDILECQKCTCMDYNNFDRLGRQQPIPVDFVTSETARLVVTQHTEYITERDKNILKIINNLECAGYAHELYHDNEEIKQRMTIIYNSIEQHDYTEFFYQCREVSKTDSARNALDSIGVIDKDLEKAVDQIRDYMYKDEVKIILAEHDNEILLSKENNWDFNNWVTKK